MIQAVLLDLDDTLCDDRGQMRRAIFQSALAGVGEARAEALARCYESLADRYWYHELTLTAPPPLAEIRTRLWRAALEETLGVVDAAVLEAVLARYDAARREPLQPFPGTLETLATLRESGLRLAVLTNGLSETHFPKAEMLGLTSLVEAVFTPDTLGAAKPDPQAFLRACECLGASPEETVHVGDSLVTDVGGARGAGLRAIWFNPARAPFEGEQIASLSELIACLL